MSNAPRPSKNVEKFLLNLKMDKIFLKKIFTSGEAALKSLKENIYGKYRLTKIVYCQKKFKIAKNHFPFCDYCRPSFKMVIG